MSEQNETETREKLDDETAKKIAEEAQKLVAVNSDCQRVVGSMVATRQLYAMLARELDVILKETDTDVEDELLFECLSQAVMAQAGKPFDENQLWNGVQATLLPTFKGLVEKHNQQEFREQQTENELFEQARRGRKLPVGIEVDPDAGSELSRDRTMILVGWRPAVEYVLDKIVANVIEAEPETGMFHVIRLTQRVITESESSQLIQLAGPQWEKCARSAKSWPQLFQSKLLPALAAPPDLLVCDSLVMSAVEPFQANFTKQVRAATQAHKHFRQWATEVGCGFIGAITQKDNHPVDLSKPNFQTLRNWTTLRSVRAEVSNMDKSCYHIFVGRSQLVAIVDREELDYKYKPKIII